VRKAGSVYYTPQYIVDYIVENTVGKLTANKTPEEIAKLKIVDPACGSGSFLIGAYQYLLNWHQQYYKPRFDELTAIAGSNAHNTKQRTDAQKERNQF
jgi:type I restriction-modification system DNA methylase subunit